MPPSEFPSDGLAIDELRRRYDDEERRRETVDTKLSGLIVLDSLIVSLIGIGFESSFLLQFLSISLLVASIVIAIYQLRGQEYSRPVKNANYFSILAQKPKDELTTFLIERYIDCVRENRTVTDRRYEYLHIGLGFTFLGLLVFLVGVLS